MAANSLLYLLLTTGLTTSPDQGPVTSESPYGINTEDAAQWHDRTTKRVGYAGRYDDFTTHRWRQETRYSTEDPFHQDTAPPVTEDIHTEDADQWHDRTTKWPGYGGRPLDRTTRWRQETSYSTEDPFGRRYAAHRGYTAPPVTEDEDADWIVKFQTERPFVESEDKTDRPSYWPFGKGQKVAERDDGLWPLATEEPVNETERPETWPHKKGKKHRKCPPREHWTKCHKNCEKTCSNHMKPQPCPRSCKKGCVCDGGLVRNKKGKCVPRDQCPQKAMAQDNDSHGCPKDKFLCDVHCITHGQKYGRCEGNICKCYER